MNTRTAASCVFVLASVAFSACDNSPTQGEEPEPSPDPQEVFRFETFGNETWWTDTLEMNQVIQAALDPLTALSVGLKVDVDALPAGILATADLSDPATTVELIRLNAVVGVRGEVDDQGNLTRMGITCALCHSTVDNSVMPGIGRRLDGWPNLDLDPGHIVSLSPFFREPAAQAVLTSWGPGMFDPRFNIDGINDPVVIPPAYGLDGVALETYTGDGPVSYWNAYVAVTQMHGHGDFSDPRIGVSVDWDEDLVTPLLEPLLEYQLSLASPPPPDGFFDPAAAGRGRLVFQTVGCADCHTGPLLTDAGDRLHTPSETCMDPTLSQRAATGMYRTTPLRALWQHAPYFHDGSAETLGAVVDHYESCLDLGLAPSQRSDLIEYLKSL
jgi:mono/diheme cytochrome c family protein